MMIKIISVFLLLLFACEGSIAQQRYRTINGTMQVTVIVNDSPLVFSTNELLIFLDYETAEFTMKMDKSTFKTGVDSIDSKLYYKRFEIIEFKGKLGVDYINTKGHPPLKFEIEGKASTNENDVIYGQGTLEHMMEGSFYSCLLSMSFNLKLSDLQLLPETGNIEDVVQIEVLQTVLNRETD